MGREHLSFEGRLKELDLFRLEKGAGRDLVMALQYLEGDKGE